MRSADEIGIPTTRAPSPVGTPDLSRDTRLLAWRLERDAKCQSTPRAWIL
jgi:hypothetical protein